MSHFTMTFPSILRLYNACRRAGVWTRLVMESEANGKETVTFSTVTKSTSRPEEKAKEGRKEGRRRIKPAKVKRDRERREAWLERRRTGVGKSVAVVPAVAPVTVPEPITPEGTDRTMVTGSTPEEVERRKPVEDPLASPVHTASLDSEQLLALSEQLIVDSGSYLQRLQRLCSTEKETTTAELPATAPVSVPVPVTVPRTPDRT